MKELSGMEVSLNTALKCIKNLQEENEFNNNFIAEAILKTAANDSHRDT